MEPPREPLLQDMSTHQQLSDLELASLGYTHWRWLTDGSLMTVGPMLFGNGRLYVDVGHGGYADCFCYDSVDGAVDAMLGFDPERDNEPAGWKRHPYSGRRRPNGDPAQDFVAR